MTDYGWLLEDGRIEPWRWEIMKGFSFGCAVARSSNGVWREGLHNCYPNKQIMILITYNMRRMIVWRISVLARLVL